MMMTRKLRNLAAYIPSQETMGSHALSISSWKAPHDQRTESLKNNRVCRSLPDDMHPVERPFTIFSVARFCCDSLVSVAAVLRHSGLQWESPCRRDLPLHLRHS